MTKRGNFLFPLIMQPRTNPRAPHTAISHVYAWGEVAPRVTWAVSVSHTVSLTPAEIIIKNIINKGY